MAMPDVLLTGPSTNIAVQWTGEASLGGKVGQAFDDAMDRWSGDPVVTDPAQREFRGHELRISNASELSGEHVPSDIRHTAVNSGFWSKFHGEGAHFKGPVLGSRIADLEAAVAALGDLPPTRTGPIQSMIPDLDGIHLDDVHVALTNADGSSKLFSFARGQQVPAAIDDVVRAATRLAKWL